MRLQEVRRWAHSRGVAAAEVRRVYEAALLHVVSRLLQAIHRESSITRLWQDRRRRWRLDVGRTTLLRAPVSGPLPFRRLEAIGAPWLLTPRKRRRVHTASAFLAGLRKCVRGSEYIRVFPALKADFENSVANVVLNRLIARSLGKKAHALEPAYEGHQYYPFPALRIGPSLSQVLACSHLCEQPVALPLLDVGSCRLVSSAFRTYEEFFRAWSGLGADRGSKVLMPVHPWQLRLSRAVRELSASVSTRSVAVVPLASQRTCRVVQTGFDIKLPVDATLTGEHRLLFRLNRENAPAVSSLARRLLRANGRCALDFQDDVASLVCAEAALASHLCAIFRAPVRAGRGEKIVPAINLWAGPHEARGLLRGAASARVEQFFHRYCVVLMSGPVQFYALWGMAFEPHLQNVYVGLRAGMPSRIVIRDLDNSILEPRRVRPLLREHGLPLQKDTWRWMPDFETGGKRLVQAMLYGHLGEVMWRLEQEHGVPGRRLAGLVEQTWSDLESSAASACARKTVAQLRGWSDAVKATLRTRLSRSTTVEFIRE